MVDAHHLCQNDIANFSVGSYVAPRWSCLEVVREDEGLLDQSPTARAVSPVTRSFGISDDPQSGLHRWVKPASPSCAFPAADSPTCGTAAAQCGRQASTDVPSDSFCRLSFSTLNLDDEFRKLKDAPSCRTVYDFAVRDSSGIPVPMEQFRGKVLLIVNVASYCGLTGQYAGLQELQATFGAEDRFSVVAFPCNQFGGQEPHPTPDVCRFAYEKFGVTFPIMDKVDVNGPDAHPLWEFLKHEQPGFLSTVAVKWNFTKFLVDREGRVRKRYSSTARPQAMAADIAQLLQ
eukprot:EG_transcript_12269